MSLSLNGLTSLDEKTAKCLAAYSGAISLSGVTTLADNVAQSLSQHRNHLSLHGLTALSPTALAALRARQNPVISLPAQFACGSRQLYDWEELRLACERSRNTFGNDHRDTVLLRTWFYVAKMRSRVASEEEAVSKAIKISSKALGDGHSETIAWKVAYKALRGGHNMTRT